MAKELREVTDVQLELMRVLWERGEATTVDVIESLSRTRRLAPTTVATMLSRLEKKELVTHRVDGRTYVYRALVEEGEVQQSLLGRLKGAFAGDLTAVMAQLLRDDEIDAGDLVKVRKMIEQRERELKESNND
jgi:predicted transcriptional regulator